MGTLYLVRHGQASFGADNYDQLSPLGQQQSVRLGEYWRRKGLKFDLVLAGTLQRHAQTWAGIRQGLGTEQDAQAWPGLNEYDAEAVVQSVHPGPHPRPTTPDEVRQHFRWLRDGLAQWMSGTVSPKGMPSYDEFVHGVTAALEHVRRHASGTALIVSSGGPIATAVGHVLGTPAESTIELNLRIRNSAVTEFDFNPKHHRLLTFNTLPHLDDEPYRDWVTYA